MNCGTLEIVEDQTTLQATRPSLSLSTVEERVALVITASTGDVSTVGTTNLLELTQPGDAVLQIEQEMLSLEMVQNALTIIKNYSGGSLADEDTIIGTGVIGDPFRTDPEIATNARDALRVSLRLSEFDTQVARFEARDNLGLDVIDGGEFI